MQSRRQSIIEVVTNTTVGMLGSFLIALAVMSMVEDRPLAAGITTLACTVWSLARGYVIRRHFNRTT